LLIQDIMDRKTARIKVGSPMRQAAEILVLTQASNLMVTDDEGRFVGILSEGDLLYAIMPDFEGLLEAHASLRKALEVFLEAGGEYADQPIDRLVVRESINLRPDDELLKAATVMVTKRVRRLAVLDGEKFVGSVSRADICWALLCSEARLSSANGAASAAAS
jgi:CBS domain-containing protein